MVYTLKLMKQLSISIAKFVLFFIAWVAAISIPLALWNRPTFIAENPAWLRLYWETAPLTMTFAVTILFIWRAEKQQIRLILSKHWLRDTAIGLGLGLGWIGMALGPLLILEKFSFGAMQPVPLFWVYVMALLMNAATQELLVRGYPFALFRARHGTIPAIIATTALFLLMHGGAFEAGPIAVLNVIAASVLFSLILIYTGGLWAPIIAHFIWNLVAGLILGNIQLGDEVHLYNSSISGHQIVSGGSAGMEGNIITLLATTLLVCLVVVLARRKPATS